MPDLALDEIERGWKLLNEGKDNEVFQLIKILEKNLAMNFLLRVLIEQNLVNL